MQERVTSIVQATWRCVGRKAGKQNDEVFGRQIVLWTYRRVNITYIYKMHKVLQSQKTKDQAKALKQKRRNWLKHTDNTKQELRLKTSIQCQKERDECSNKKCVQNSELGGKDVQQEKVCPLLYLIIRRWKKCTRDSLGLRKLEYFFAIFQSSSGTEPGFFHSRAKFQVSRLTVI